MKPLTLVLGAALAPLLVGQADVRTALDARYAAMSKAIVKKDWPGVRAILTSDMKLKTAEGTTMSLKEVEQNWKQMFAATKKIEAATFKITSLKMNGADAIAQTTSNVVVLVDNPETKKTSKVEVANTGRATWVQQSGVWRIKHIEQLSSRMKVDGKEVPLRGG